jgi:hypothetical protein
VAFFFFYHTLGFHWCFIVTFPQMHTVYFEQGHPLYYIPLTYKIAFPFSWLEVQPNDTIGAWEIDGE